MTSQTQPKSGDLSILGPYETNPIHNPVVISRENITKVLHYLTDTLCSVSEFNTGRYIAAMANNVPAIPPALSDFIETTRREGFVAGWRACQAAMTEAITKMDDPAEGFEIGDAVRAPVIVTMPGDPKTGSTPWVVLQAVRKQHGMTGAEIVSVVQEGGHKVSEASIRTSLIRLERKRLIVSRHKKWFPQGA